MTKREFSFMHEDPRVGVGRQLDGVARPDYRIWILHEHIERTRLALRMFPVIGQRTQDLVRARQWRPQPHRGQRKRRCVLVLDPQECDARVSKSSMMPSMTSCGV